MLSKIKFAVGLTLAVVLVAITVAISLKSRSGQEVIQTATPSGERETVAINAPSRHEFGPDTQPVAEQIKDSREFDLPAGKIALTMDLALLDSLNFIDVRDVKLIGNRILLATAGGVVEFFKDDSSFSIYSNNQGLENHDAYALLPMGKNLYVGTSDGVYCIDELGMATKVWHEISGTVHLLKKFDGVIYVGGSKGLFRINVDTIDQILADRSVVALTSNQFGLWVGTSEEGLLFYDGEKWHRRYLLRDSTAFANVTALESAHGKLYVGTSDGLWLFNGGSWEKIDTTDHLFDQQITALSFGMKYVYIGTTESGLFCYYDNSLSPLDWSEGYAVRSIDVDNGNYLVGLQNGGAVLKTTEAQYEVLTVIKGVHEILSAL